MSVTRTVTRTVALTAGAALVLAACGSGESTTGDPAASASPTPSSTVGVPGSVTLTEPGADVSFGDTAAVIFEPTQTRGTVLELTVKGARKGTTGDLSGFILDDYTKAATPYYVDVSVANVGEGEVGAVPVPLWGVDGENTLLPAASFTTSFSECASEPLPESFAAGESMDTCLVYLSPDKGSLEGVSFRPEQEFDPIQWTGEIATPEPQPETQPEKTKKKKKPGSRA